MASSMAGEGESEDGIVVENGEVMQTYLLKKYKVDDLYHVLNSAKMNGRSEWWQRWEVVKVYSPRFHQQIVKLRCTLCAGLFTASNPSQRASTHFGNGKGACPVMRGVSAPPPTEGVEPVDALAAGGALLVVML